MVQLSVFLKFSLSSETWAKILLFGVPILLVLALFNAIIQFFKGLASKKEKREIEKLESNWASPEGQAFYEKLVKRINNNESCLMHAHQELSSLEGISEEAVNALFGVMDSKYSLRIWYCLCVLNDRFEMENKTLVGVSAERVQAIEGVNLDNDEVLIEKFDNCCWFELKRSKQRSFGYHGLGIRIPLVANATYRLGNIQRIEPESKQEYSLEATGTLYVTNQRLIFLGLDENKVIALNAIIDLEQFRDCLVIGKERGKKPIVKFEFDDAALCSRLIVRTFQFQ